MSPRRCPNRTELSAYVLGKLPEDAIQALADHTSNCAECQATLQRLDALSDPLLAHVRHPRPRDAAPDEPSLKRFLQKATAIPDTHEPPTSSADSRAQPPVVNPVPVPQFLTGLLESGLLSAQEIKGLHRQAQRDARRLADELIEQGKLTPYQAAMLCRGKGQELVLGNYMILDQLAKGGMGEVFKARHQRMGRLVALKVLPKAVNNHPAAVQRFQREVQAAARLDHPNIVRAHDADQAHGVHFLVMELVDGMDLAQVVKQVGPLPVSTAVGCVLQAADGLKYAHAAGIVHRDIKPHNLLLDRNGIIKVLDLGLARVEGGSNIPGSAGDLTGPTTVMGSSDYMAPEQALNTRNADQRADVYGLGCTLYFLVAGRPMYRGDTVMEKLVAHREEAIPRLPEAPAQLQETFQSMVAKEMGHRYQSMAEVIAVLEGQGYSREVRISLPEPVAPATLWDVDETQRELPRPITPWKQRRSGLLIAGAAFLAVLAAVLLFPGSRAPESADATLSTASSTSMAKTPVAALPELVPPPSVIALPIDALRREGCLPYELAVAGGGDPARAPAELVAVWGDSRLKHWRDIRSLTFSPDGKLLASLGKDAMFAIWDTATGEAQHIHQGRGPVALSPDFRLLASTGPDGSVTLQDLATRELITLPGVRAEITALMFRPDGRALLSCAKNGTVAVWDPVAGKRLHLLDGDRADYSPDGRWLAVIRNQRFLLYAAAKPEDILFQTPADVPVPSVQLSPDGRFASHLAKGSIRRWDLIAKKELPSLITDHSGFSYSPDGAVLATWGWDKVALWDTATAKQLHQFDSHAYGLYGATFSPDGRTLVIHGNSNSLQFVDVATGKKIGRPDLGTSTSAAAYSPDGRTLATSTQDGVIYFWDAEAQRRRLLHVDDRGRFLRARIAPDGRTVAAVTSLAPLGLWKLPAGKPRFFGKAGALRGNMAASTDGKYLATWGHPGDPQLCDSTGTQLRTFPGASELAFSADSKTLAVRKGERLTFVELPELTARPSSAGMEPEFLDAFAYSPDGRTLALGSKHRPWTFRLWDLIENKELRTLGDMGFDVSSVQFSRDGKLLITTYTYDSNTRVSDAVTGKSIHRLSGISPALSPDGKSLATGGDGVVRLFDLETGKETRAIAIGPPGGAIRQILYTPEGRHLITVNGNGTLYVLRLAPAP